jgi:kinesin family member 26
LRTLVLAFSHFKIPFLVQYASLRHPDGASDPNLATIDKPETNETDFSDHIKENPLAEFDDRSSAHKQETRDQLPQLPLLPISTPEAYDSGHDSTPRTSKHSGISRRAESGYHSVATVRDSDESSFGSRASRSHHHQQAKNTSVSSGSNKKSKRSDKSLCHWLRNPFTCTYPDTEGEVSDF